MTDVPRRERFVSFHGIDGLEAKLDSLLDTFEFGTAAALRTRTTNRPPEPVKPS